MVKFMRNQKNQECFYSECVSKGRYELVVYMCQQIQTVIVREGRKNVHYDTHIPRLFKLNNEKGKILVLLCEHP